MDRKFLVELWHSHNGKIIGMIIGFIVSILIIIFGFFQTVFMALCVTLGYFIGKRIDAKEKLSDFLEKIIPSDYRR